MVGAQQKTSLSDYLPKLGWDAAKTGPLLVVDPDHTRLKTNGFNLIAFDRKLVTVGKMSAVVPTDMVLIDDSFKEPNLYDGLPREAKVLYLLSTLNSHQVELANKDGIGQSDLHGEQVKVLKSILPPSLAWKLVQVNDQGRSGKDLQQGVVPPEQMDQVKLKIQSQITFHLGFQGQPGAYRPFSASEFLGKSGEKVLVRSQNDSEDTFSADPCRITSNKLKASQLNYDDPAFNSVIPIPNQTSIKELLRLIGSRTGLEIHAHLRVGVLPVKTFGSEARVTDLLKAIALGVTGTYRKVGTAYVLTSDLIGVSSRKLKFAAWASSAVKEMYSRETLWRKQVLQSGSLAKVGFDPNDPMRPDERTRQSLDRVNDAYMDDKVSTSELTPEMRSSLDRYVANNPDQGVLLDRVGLHSDLQFKFVLPNGQTLRPEPSGLGEHSMFNPPTFPHHNDPPYQETYRLNPNGTHPMIVRAESDQEARNAVDLARAHGIAEVWLQTHRKSALMAATNREVKVSLVIRPWEAFDRVAVQDIDRNVLGLSATQLSTVRNGEPDWQEHVKNADGSGIGPPVLYDLVNPIASGLEHRWDTLGELARTPGLASIVVLDTEPLGFEPVDGRTTYGGYAQWLGALNEFGYSESMRLAFLREHQIDPIDIDRPELFPNMAMEQPFFRDYAYVLDGRDNDETQDMRLMLSAWYAFRAKLNKAGTESLITRLGDVSVPLFIMPRTVSSRVPPETGQFVIPMPVGHVLPKYDPSDRSMSFARTMEVYTLNEDSSEVAVRDLGWRLKEPNLPVAVDVTSVKADRLHKLLDRWFPRVAEH